MKQGKRDPRRVGAGQSARSQDCDVLVVGGGMVGLALGLSLGGAGVKVTVLDRQDPAVALAEPFDGRSSAIAKGSKQALESAGLWIEMAPHAQPILDIRVSDGQVGRRPSSFFLHYDHRDLDQGPLGYIIENRMTRRALHGAIAARPKLDYRAPCKLESLERTAGGVVATLADGTVVRARLAVAAEGRNSALREAAGIKTTGWDYRQSGIVCTIAHDKPHNGVAHEHFLSAGPFAVLPMVDAAADEGGPVLHRSSIVWTERRDLAPAMMDLSPEDFSSEIERRFGKSLGSIQAIGGRWCYPLSLLHAERLIDTRLALVGDAAHGIHPIAGQGLNLGLRDVAALAEIVVDAHRLGLDVGATDVLTRYQRWRRADNFLLIAATDGLNRLFSNDIVPVRLARDLGLGIVNRLPPAKRFFMRHAMGMVGDLPRMIRGEAL